MRKERDMTINVIKINKVNNMRLAKFFANEYMKNKKDALKEKS